MTSLNWRTGIRMLSRKTMPKTPFCGNMQCHNKTPLKYCPSCYHSYKATATECETFGCVELCVKQNCYYCRLKYHRNTHVCENCHENKCWQKYCSICFRDGSISMFNKIAHKHNLKPV